MPQSKNRNLFAGRKLIIATKHNKELVISPILTKKLAVECFINKNLDTDSLGTFTGEIERLDDVLETARKKCLMAMKISNCDMAVASEGSFGPHPTLGFINANDEILLFIDKKNDLEIVIRERSFKTNFNGQEIKSVEQLNIFATKAQFPSHGLIIRKAYGDNSEIIKGIIDSNVLKKSFESLKNKYGSVYIETDMRAMFNPTRMKVIKKAAQKLVDKITSFCPQCYTPGFGITNANAGLPCSLCSFPTRTILSYEYKCIKCQYKEDKKYPHNKTTEEPTFCDNCNP
ncbi:MAG: hypothetical protein Q7W45_15660 [Bacteroidota bacterium]|nr:hypothetical protein [Bacteroidota bacterium]MDP3145549.1 hypothetical protein [Bacteroidota bacterium]MDP3557983.1 hypothetical protein [Bacteroidota bacterium]